MIAKFLYSVFLSTLFLLLASCSKREEILCQKISLSTNWNIHHTDSIQSTGDIISTSQQSVEGWYKATVPSTVMGVLTANGLYPDLFVGSNYKSIDRSLFDKSFWYRNEFALPKLNEEQHVILNFDGISYRANIWLNGKQIASRDSVYGSFRHFSFNITPYIESDNILAIEVFKAGAADSNIGFADWIPRPADENMGLFRGVSLDITGNVRLNNNYVQTKVNTSTLDEAWLTVETELLNLSDEEVSGELIGTLENNEFTYPVTLAPKEKKKIKITQAEVPSLHIRNPRLWWCNNMGSPELYNLDLAFKTGHTVSDKATITFGIREIESYLTEKGYRGFKLNGKKVLLKAAAWTDDIFLRDTPESNELQVQYAKDMNLNMIRFDSFWGISSNVYALCDKYGLMAFFNEADSRISVGISKEHTSEQLGETGTKMVVPYEYVSPNYWYIDTLYGGAFGYNTEAGIGAQLPVLESIRKFIPDNKLWPISDAWNYHCTASSTAMNSLNELTAVINAKYGKAKDLADYLTKADLVNYDGTRAMFEAFRANLDKTTGVVQWMLNSAWPSLYWQLYDYYKVPTAAYYSVKKANLPLQLIYNYGNNSIYAVNESLTDVEGHKAIVQVFDIDSKLKDKKETILNIKSSSSSNILQLPPLTANVFLSLQMTDNEGKTVADNFYALSSKADEYYWQKTDWEHTPAKSYGDFKKLSGMKPVELSLHTSITEKDNDHIYTFEIENPTPTIAFFTDLKLKDNKGEIIVPSFWSDNYISLLPGQKKTLECKVNKRKIAGKHLKIEIKGWNVPLSEINLN